MAESGTRWGRRGQRETTGCGSRWVINQAAHLAELHRGIVATALAEARAVAAEAEARHRGELVVEATAAGAKEPAEARVGALSVVGTNRRYRSHHATGTNGDRGGLGELVQHLGNRPVPLLDCALVAKHSRRRGVDH